MNIKEMLDRLRGTRKTKADRIAAIQSKAMEDDRTKSDEEREETDTLKAEIASLDREISDLEDLERMNIGNAADVVVDKGIGGPATPLKDATKSRDGVTVKNNVKLEPGIRFARFVMAMTQAKGDPARAFAIARNSPIRDDEAMMNVFKAQAEMGETIHSRFVQKANVNAGTTQDSTWAAPLVQYQDFANDFVEFLRPQTILGKFGAGNVPGLRRVPFNIRVPKQTSGGAANWVGEGKPKPLTKFDFGTDTLPWAKVAAIAVITEELARFSSPAAEGLVRDALRDAIIGRLDLDFIDPGKAAVANVSPASITNGVAGISSTGSDAASIRRDIRNLWAPFITANISPTQAVYIMTATTALALSLMENDLGTPLYPGMTINGGTLKGVPVIVSEYLDNTAGSAGGIVVLANASDIWLADDGEVSIDSSREASLQMDDSPTNTADTGAEQSLVSMWQTNSIAIKAERYIYWKLRRSAAVSWLDAVQWGQGAI